MVQITIHNRLALALGSHEFPCNLSLCENVMKNYGKNIIKSLRRRFKNNRDNKGVVYKKERLIKSCITKRKG